MFFSSAADLSNKERFGILPTFYSEIIVFDQFKLHDLRSSEVSCESNILDVFDYF